MPLATGSSSTPTKHHYIEAQPSPKRIRSQNTYHHVRATLGGVADGGGAPFDNEASRYRGWGRRCRCRCCPRRDARRLTGFRGRCWCNDRRCWHRLILVGAGLIRTADNAADDGHTCSRGRWRTRCSGQLIRRQRAPNVFTLECTKRKIKGRVVKRLIDLLAYLFSPDWANKFRRAWINGVERAR